MLFTGRCLGGPLDGEEGQSRFPRGFVLIDKPAGQVWIYDWSEPEWGDGVFRVRDPHPMAVLTEARRRAAEGIRYDVRAAPWVGVP